MPLETNKLEIENLTSEELGELCRNFIKKIKNAGEYNNNKFGNDLMTFCAILIIKNEVDSSGNSFMNFSLSDIKVKDKNYGSWEVFCTRDSQEMACK